MTKAKQPAHGEAEAILDGFGLEALCDALVAGEPQRAICKKLGVAPGSLRRWIALDAERQARVHEARVDAATAWDEKAEEAILKARGKDGIAKGRELAHHYRWRASKADPRRYGDKLEIDQTTTVINLSDEEIARRAAAIRAKLFEAEKPPAAGG